MKLASFIKILSLCIFCSVTLHALLSLILPLKDHFLFAAFNFIFFFIVLLLSYFIGRMLIHKSNKNAFTAFSMSIIMIKLVAAIAIVAFYQNFASPDNHYFLLIFLIYYLVFTFGEVHVLMKLSKSALT